MMASVNVKKENTTADAVGNVKKSSQWLEVWGRLKKNKMAVAGLIVLLFLIIIAIFADKIAPYGYDDQDISRNLLFPCKEFLLGTDNLGRDILSRIIYGARISLRIGLISVGISAVSGVILGAVAGYYSGKVDNIIMRIMDILLAIPGILLAIAIAATLGPGMDNAMISVGISGMPSFARLIRSSVLSVRDMEYIEAAKAINASDARIISTHILPNVLGPIIVQVTLGVAGAILTAASLSFLGLGVQPPIPEWGSMLSGTRAYMRDYWFVVTFPGLAIMLTVFSLNLLGDGLRDALDPRLKN